MKTPTRLFLSAACVLGFISQPAQGASLSDFNEYRSEPCSRNSSNGRYRICNDGSISYHQPDGPNRAEGLCGQTAAANVIHMQCQGVHPGVKSIANDIWDSTPGTRPNTLESGLNRNFTEINRRNLARYPRGRCGSAQWARRFAGDPGDYLQSIASGLRAPGGLTRKRSDGTRVKRAPVPVVLSVPGSAIESHWVTVVDIEGFGTSSCRVYYNHWGTQAKTHCDEFRMLADMPARIWGLGSEVRIVLRKR